MTVIDVNHHRAKDLLDWTPADVQDFVEQSLPGHPCVQLFGYTSGFVLSTMDKEDLRRQTRDEEAANILWAHLKLTRRQRGGVATKGATSMRVASDDGRDDTPAVPKPRETTMTVYVARAHAEEALELEVRPTDTVASLKALVAERECRADGSWRLVTRGMIMQDDRTLGACGLVHGTSVLLVPQLNGPAVQGGQGGPPPAFAPRGLLMMPNSKSWAPQPAVRPYVPILCCDVSRQFPINLEFLSTADSEAFASQARLEPPVLRVEPPPGVRGQVTEARLHFDVNTGGVRMEATGDTLAAGTRYEGVVFFGGRGGEMQVSVVTGAAVA